MEFFQLVQTRIESDRWTYNFYWWLNNRKQTSNISEKSIFDFYWQGIIARCIQNHSRVIVLISKALGNIESYIIHRRKTFALQYPNVFSSFILESRKWSKLKSSNFIIYNSEFWDVYLRIIRILLYLVMYFPLSILSVHSIQF